MSKLIVLKDYPQKSIFKALTVLIIRRTLKKYNTDCIFVSDASAAEILKDKKAYSWDLMRKTPPAEARSIEPLLKFNQKAVVELEKNQVMWIHGVSIPRAMSYLFVAPHAEYLPYTVAAIQEFIKKIKPIEIVLLGKNLDVKEELLKRVAEALKISIKVETGFLYWISDRLHQWKKRYLKFLFWWQVFMRLIPPQKVFKPLPEKSALWICNTKWRTQSSWRKLIPELEKKHLHYAIVSNRSSEIYDFQKPQSFASINFLTRFSRLVLFAKFFQLHRIWKKIKPVLARDTSLFMGVRFADIHLEEMEKAWIARGPELIMSLEVWDSVMRSQRPSSLLVFDPTDLPQSLIQLSKKYSVPSYFYWSIDDGLTITRAIWEPHVEGDNILTLNANQLLSRQSTVVGNIAANLTDQSKEQLRSKISALLELNLKKYWVLLLSRHPSRDLSQNERKLYYQTVYQSLPPNSELIVKCHPFENIAVTQEEMAAWGVVGKVLKKDFDISLPELSKACDVVCNIPASSSTLEVLSVGTPAVIIKQAGRDPSKDIAPDEISNTCYEKFDAVAIADSADHCREILLKIKNDELYRNQLVNKGFTFCEYLNGPRSGSVAERIIKAVTIKSGIPGEVDRTL